MSSPVALAALRKPEVAARARAHDLRADFYATVAFLLTLLHLSAIASPVWTSWDAAVRDARGSGLTARDDASRVALPPASAVAAIAERANRASDVPPSVFIRQGRRCQPLILGWTWEPRSDQRAGRLGEEVPPTYRNSAGGGGGGGSASGPAPPTRTGGAQGVPERA